MPSIIVNFVGGTRFVGSKTQLSSAIPARRS
jgi:hypothetical protein